MKTLITTVFLFSLLMSCSSKMDFHQNKIIAHRGAWKNLDLPQNSLASLERAVELGCEGSEFDVWMTADSVLVVNHDADFEGMIIEESTYEQLLTKKHKNGEKIATVEEYLNKGMQQTSTKLIFEIKPSKISTERSEYIAEKSVKTVQQLNAEKWVDYITFSYEGGLRAIALDPTANVAYLNGDKSPSELKEAGFFGFDYNIKLLRQKPEWIKEAQNLGLTVNAWTVNKREDMQWLLEQNVDFITTDEPEILFKLINE
ncbi:glycerophosphodiester phosphodiesterase [Echinicola soli]|uniref:Glycerophosphodiester phosphodiesterase n=1 Tax=Echinicola soli TaxID=2591634 RepID=A0A514CKL2_9BACT|nr:glycerophosphodiester phosphodiesterase family protein [Echinicola soli]QDH80320.1 glycerophosphodiester phosphodiesterase [Echinicola soli]